MNNIYIYFLGLILYSTVVIKTFFNSNLFLSNELYFSKSMYTFNFKISKIK